MTRTYNIKVVTLDGISWGLWHNHVIEVFSLPERGRFPLTPTPRRHRPNVLRAGVVRIQNEEATIACVVVKIHTKNRMS